MLPVLQLHIKIITFEMLFIKISLVMFDDKWKKEEKKKPVEKSTVNALELWCTCQVGMMKGLCKYELGIQMILRKVICSPAAKKRKSGRSQKASRALMSE